MVIIFYNANEDKIYICTESEKTKIVDYNDPDLMSYIPNDDILYVENGKYLTKKQFSEWLTNPEIAQEDEEHTVNRFTGMMKVGPKSKTNFTTTEETETRKVSSRQFLHTTKPGSIRLNDIRTRKYPDGVEIQGKWNFVPIDDIGWEVLQDSKNFHWAINNKKIEIVDEQFVRNNMHRNRQVSAAEASLNAILVPAEIKAEAAADAGGIHRISEYDGAMEFLVEGD